ncbi:MAG: ribonuclease HII [Chloroflexi bacterium]|nr:ribonuclease HII [Chloroflexota bacterium]
MDRLPSLGYEQDLWGKGYRIVAGIDEAGRGAWAGPVVAAAAVFRAESAEHCLRRGLVRDSKLLTPRQRDRCYDLILESADYLGTGVVSSQEIDRLGILAATREAMRIALLALPHPPDHLLIDAVRLREVPLPQTAIIRGDRVSLSIAAASVVAKVTRDRLMREWDRRFPSYGFAAHKGYGTERHQRALALCGPCAIHRVSFAPVAASSKTAHG